MLLYLMYILTVYTCAIDILLIFLKCIVWKINLYFVVYFGTLIDKCVVKYSILNFTTAIFKKFKKGLKWCEKVTRELIKVKIALCVCQYYCIMSRAYNDVISTSALIIVLIINGFLKRDKKNLLMCIIAFLLQVSSQKTIFTNYYYQRKYTNRK